MYVTQKLKFYILAWLKIDIVVVISKKKENLSLQSHFISIPYNKGFKITQND